MGKKGWKKIADADLFADSQKLVENKHYELCRIAAKWLRQPGRIDPPSCPFAAVELVTINQETPDVYGWNGWSTVLIEVKMSRSDFFADAKKWFRIHPEEGLGEQRFYCCPRGLIKPDEIPEKWGLLYFENGKIVLVKNAERQEADYRAERKLIFSIFRRENIKPQLFDYKQKKKEQQK